MLFWALVLFVAALTAALLALAGGATGLAKVLYAVFVLSSLLYLIWALRQRDRHSRGV